MPHLIGPIEVALIFIFLGIMPLGPSLTPVMLLLLLAGQPMPESLARTFSEPHPDSLQTLHQDSQGASSCLKPCPPKTSSPH